MFLIAENARIPLQRGLVDSPACQLFSETTLSWIIATLLVHMVSMADFGYSSRVVKCDRDHMACKAQHVYYLAFHNESWPTSKVFHVSPLRSE